MAITLNGSTGISTPGMTNAGNDTISGNETVAGTLQVGGISTNLYPIVSGTAVASTSGTSIDFTSIPSWVKRITVMFAGVSTNGSSIIQVQIGSGSVTTSGYASTASYGTGNASQYTYASTGFILEASGAASASFARSGVCQVSLIGSNTWVSFGNTSSGSGAVTSACAGNSPALGGTLDRVRITTVNGTDTFDAGGINILYE